jgi:5,6,7,8-tetrahydromethanopterin hydro-lyase
VFVATLARPTPGHIPFLACVQPNVAARPRTVFVNKAPYAHETHARLTWGPAQAGVAEALAEAGLRRPELADMVGVATVWLAPEATDADAVYANNRDATARAVESATRGGPTAAEVASALACPFNGFFRPGPDGARVLSDGMGGA